MITFAGLSEDVVGRVVEKFVMQLEAQLADRNVTIELSSAPRSGSPSVATIRCMVHGLWPRVIQEHIKKPLAEELLFGKLVKGGSVKVQLVDGKLAFDVTEATPPASPPSPRVMVTRAAQNVSRRSWNEGDVERRTGRRER